MSTAARAGEAPVTGAAYTEFLSKLPFFVGVPHEDLSSFANTVLVRQMPANTDVVVQRQYGHAMFVIMQGAVVVHAIGPDDTPVKLGRIDQPGNFFGEAALLGRGERTATVTTETDVVLLEIEKHRFDLLTRRYKSVREHLEGVYHARAIATYMRTHRYLSMLDDASRAELGRGARLKLFQRGDQITKKDDPADTILVLKDGVVKATRHSGGQVSILAYFNTHDVVGVSDGVTRDFGLEAVGQCEVIFLPRNAFSLTMGRHTEVAKHFGKDDMIRKAAMTDLKGTVMMAAQAFLSAGVEVESLLVINLDRCVRCGNCVRACHSRHTYTRLDRRGPIFRRRAKLDARQHEHIMLPASCRHCRDPECMIGCPTGAIQRFADGDVDINDNCIGCQNCARKCPYGNITMRPLAEKDRPSPEVTQRAIKCNLCRGYEYSNCVHECPRGALLRVDPLRYFDELALVMEAEQRDAINWSRKQAQLQGTLGTKQQIKPRSTWFIPASFLFGILAIAGIVAATVLAKAPLRGGSSVGLPLGIGAASALLLAAFQGVRKRMRNTAIGGLEAWTQFHMVLGAVGFFAAVAHAGFAVTGIFTTLLLVVFAIEVTTGITGQIIYATVPSALTRLERHGLARLVEDLLDEQNTLARSISELIATIQPKNWKALRPRVEGAVGSLHDRMGASYDPSTAVLGAKKKLEDGLAGVQISDEERNTLLRLVENQCRLVDVRAQLLLHRRLKRWLVAHVATASALVVLLAFHVVTAFTLII
ncbi:MAG: cyclic nucleotide-binding domain-containing protein [Deltaproteobacteria bacterium]|nr:cyclic nucleotide-binding domain-containing protein [Deltaproteobacteria bacterium]MCW5805038.1 cyclic nucleotide-binding domain-containing protein [Deltaproteobacteria bacterium]